jgi:hypothetical protein
VLLPCDVLEHGRHESRGVFVFVLSNVLLLSFLVVLGLLVLVQLLHGLVDIPAGDALPVESVCDGAVAEGGEC